MIEPAGKVLASALRDPRQHSRSRLYRWMRQNHDELSAWFAERRAAGDRPAWRPLAREFSRRGLTDLGGEQVTPETARKTWWRVRRDVARVRVNREGTRLPSLARAALSVPAAISAPVQRQWSERLPVADDDAVQDVFNRAFASRRHAMPRQVKREDH